MFKIDLLRSQHDDVLAMADRLLQLVDHYDRRKAAIPIVMQLNRLLGLLRVHLAHEEIQLYPTLIASSDAEVVRTGQRHVDEMRGLAGDFESFARRWPCSDSIGGNLEEFRQAVRHLLLALAVRIERENLYLYPLAEAEARRQSCKAA